MNDNKQQRVALVTGANNGIGLELTRNCLQMNLMLSP